ncbi:MAG TPA: DUF1538 domain-containing protein [Dehalococcoidales bacterium]|nr:DUF1538 domain-containing protein [Dehalococcoidales bacterium]
MFQDVQKTIKDVLFSLLPVVLAVIVLQLTILRAPLEAFLLFLAGSVLVMTGIVLFLTGIKFGVLPVGRDIGAELPKRGSLWFVIIAGAILGFTVTLAEPGVMVLKNMVNTASDAYLASPLIFIIAGGVTVFIVLSLLRILLNWDMRYLLIIAYSMIIILATFTPPDLLSIAFDSGGVSAGPLTVPMFLTLGLGFTSVLARRTQFSDGFGLIGLACAGPVIGLMLWGVINL